MSIAISNIHSSPPTETQLAQLDAHLSNIIASSKQIAIIAEELLREFSTLDKCETSNAMTTARIHQTLQAAAVAPRLLAATQQQLDSLNTMLRMD